MRLTRLVCVFISAAAAAVSLSGQTTVDVRSFGATGNGINDDTRAIQAAIDNAALTGGGVVRIPAGTYLLNSYFPSPHPWVFYNLRVGSNIRLQGEGGATLLQGPGGRAPLPAGASTVGNNVVVFGSANFPINTFQESGYNGGFFRLKPTEAGSQSVTFANRGDMGRFKAGDYVVVYNGLPGDVIPSESSEVVSVSPKGALTLKYALARPFATPYIVNVTRIATRNTGLSGLTVRGAMPLYVNEIFGFTATGNTFISDTTVGGSNGNGNTLNNIRGFTFTGNTVTAAGPSYTVEELPQRNSQDVIIDSNTYVAASIGTGEYGAHWKINNNAFILHPGSSSATGLAFGGLDMIFSNNRVQGTITGGRPLVTDSLAFDTTMPNFGRIQILNNTFECVADGSMCLKVVTTGAVLQGNQFRVTTPDAPSLGILIEGAAPQAVQIRSNQFSIQNGTGVILNSPVPDASTISCNTVAGAGRAGIYLPSRATANSKVETIGGNTITGFSIPIDFDPAKFPGTVVETGATSCR